MKNYLFFALAIIFTLSGNAQKLKYPKKPISTNDATVIGKLKYPYHFKYEGNPLSRLHGAADPSVHVWDNKVWVITSQDRHRDTTKHSFGYAAMDGYYVFSTSDMVNWTNHGEVFNYSMLNRKAWGSTPETFMWAPGAARIKDTKGKWKYFLYYPHNTKFNGQQWVTGVATAPTPIGPYTDHGPLKNETMGMDPMVFIDDDGQAYCYSNKMIMAKLNPDMVSFAEKPRSINYAPDSIQNNKVLCFNEGLYMHKRNGIYYLSYTNWRNSEFQGFYAMGNSPYGPFEWKGSFAPKPQGSQDHHSIIEFKGVWYYFYHIAFPNNELPKYKEAQGRIVCFDKLYYNADGTIQMVKHTR